MKRILFSAALMFKKHKARLFGFDKIVWIFSLSVIFLIFVTMLSCGKNPNSPAINGGTAGDGTSLDLDEKAPDSSSEIGWLLIKTPGELIYLGKNQSEIAGNSIKIMNNLDLQGSSLEVITIFDKTFDGNNRTIENFEIKKAGDNNIGLIGTLKSGGVVKNLGLKGAVIEGNNIVGAIVANNSGTVINCYNSGSVKGAGNAIGGIVGANAASSKVDNCYNTGSVSGIQVGGVVGNNKAGTVENCYNTGEVNSVGVSVVYAVSGGIAGYNGGSLKNSYNIGVISGIQAGGVAGNNAKTISSCYFLGTVDAGGVVVGDGTGSHSFSSYPFSTPVDWDALVWKNENVNGIDRPVLIGSAGSR